MTVKKQVTIGIVMVAAATLLLGTGTYAGFAVRDRQQARELTALSARDQKIMSVIIKRNPTATIRDFQGFPNKLAEDAQALGLDFRYVMALIDKESEWNPKAVSSAGAIGLMQVMPETAALVVKKMGWDGYEPPSPNRASTRYASLGSLGDPEWNLRIGVRFLKWQIEEYGLGPEHLRAYNRGGSLARVHWPNDRYAEDIGLKLVALVHQLKTDESPAIKASPAPVPVSAPLPAPAKKIAPPMSKQPALRPVIQAAPTLPVAEPVQAVSTSEAVRMPSLFVAPGRLPSLIHRLESKRPTLPSLVIHQPEYDRDGIPLPKWGRALTKWGTP